ncbi:MAG TPA: NUDIX hydrolase [Candidatus Woesearchaeota archaeon]|nr:NUDIX hydrolase [Candidatus Woesearchaeota archaeon]
MENLNILSEKNKEDHPYVGVDNIIINSDGKILLIKRSLKSKNYPGYWGLVGGWMQWGETVEDALKREAKEEIGCEIDVIRFTGRYYDAKGRHPTKTSLCLPHLTKITKGIPIANQPEEILDVGWFSPKEIKTMELAYDHKKMLSDEGLI